MKKILTTALAGLMLCTASFATENAADSTAKHEGKKAKKEVKYNEKGEIIKTGINFGPLPVVAFDADRGFQYGALLNIYNFGDGSTYPNPKSWWYIEASAYTGGTWNLYLNYDKRDIWENTRLSICTNYSNESALDFYGLNGYQSIYTYALDDFFQNNPGEFIFDQDSMVMARLLRDSIATADRCSEQRLTSLVRLLKISSGKLDIHSTGLTTRSLNLKDIL